MPGFLIFFFHHYVCSNFTQHKECWLSEPSTHKRSCHLIEIPACQAHFSMFFPLLENLYNVFLSDSHSPPQLLVDSLSLPYPPIVVTSFFDLKPWRSSFVAHVFLDVWSSGAWLKKQGLQTENWLSLSITYNSSIGVNGSYVYLSSHAGILSVLSLWRICICCHGYTSPLCQGSSAF